MNPRPAEGVSSCIRKLLPKNELPVALVVGTGKSHLDKTVLNGILQEVTNTNY